MPVIQPRYEVKAGCFQILCKPGISISQNNESLTDSV